MNLPRTATDRAALRAQRRAEGAARGRAAAIRSYSSIKCGEHGRHADTPGGCANDGDGCLCECHDGQPAPAEMLRRASAVARAVLGEGTAR